VVEEIAVNLVLVLIAALAAADQAPETVKVVSKTVERKSRLPGEFLPQEAVDLHARVPGFVEKVLVDRGSVVKKGQLLVELSAPEMKAQQAEARAKIESIVSQRGELEARRLAAEATFERLKNASATPGAVAANELVQAEKAAEAARAAVRGVEGSIKAAQAAVTALEDLESYLRVTAPFDGVITERRVHPGALAGPTMGPLLHLEHNARLRLIVAVPESDVGGIVRGARVAFQVPAYPGRIFFGIVARIPQSMDAKTRTMPVELDVDNSNGLLAPGMYPEVEWPVRRPRPSLLVPPSAVATNTERTFVIRVSDGRAEWVDVKKGASAGDLIEVLGTLKAGDIVLRRASDEIRHGSTLK
jgi:RND family efflux transporter MFP subunit